MGTIVSPVREQLRGEMLAALAAAGEAMTSSTLFQECPSATSTEEIARLAYELKKKGLIADGGKVDHPRGTPVNSYVLGDASAVSRFEAAKPIQVEPKIKKNRQPAVKRKPAPGHPFAAPISPKAPQERITRPLPIHLQSAAPIAVQEAPVSEDPLQYVTDAFSLEPREPEENGDSDLVDASLELAHQEVIEADIADELLAKMVPLPMAEDADEPVKKVCKCVRINSLPPLPIGYRYASVVASIFSDEDGETLDVHVVKEDGGPFVKIYTTGGLSFGPGELAMVGQAADALINLLRDNVESSLEGIVMQQTGD